MTDTIIEFINKNEDICIEWVTECFNGKYTSEQVKYFLYHTEPGKPRAGVVELSNEFKKINNPSDEVIKDWYKSTDYYVFDLLPWNGCSMFRSKIDEVVSMINSYGFKTVTDFGGGLGILSIFLAQETDIEKIIYVDLTDGITFNFAKFLIKKLDLESRITVMGDDEYFNSSERTDVIISLDCFEHIPNMEEVFDKLTEHSYVIIHDSTFFKEEWSPQHVYTPTMVDFLNMVLLRNYVPRNNPKVLWRSFLAMNDAGNININFV